MWAGRRRVCFPNRGSFGTDLALELAKNVQLTNAPPGFGMHDSVTLAANLSTAAFVRKNIFLAGGPQKGLPKLSPLFWSFLVHVDARLRASGNPSRVRTCARSHLALRAGLIPC